jgi:hypothetical protein
MNRMLWSRAHCFRNTSIPRPPPSMAYTSESSRTTIRALLCEVTAWRNLNAAHPSHHIPILALPVQLHTPLLPTLCDGDSRATRTTSYPPPTRGTFQWRANCCLTDCGNWSNLSFRPRRRSTTANDHASETGLASRAFCSFCVAEFPWAMLVAHGGREACNLALVTIMLV